MAKRIAYVPALCGQRDGSEVEGKPWGVALVTEGEAGYRPLDCYAYETEERARLCVDALNERIGRTRDDALDIVSDSHRVQAQQERRGGAR